MSKRVILSIFIVICLFAMLFTFIDKKGKVTLETSSLSSNTFAIMIKQADGTYKESKNGDWPTDGYTYNNTKSGCIDVNGNKLEGVLTYDAERHLASVLTDITSSCFLYFDPIN